MVITLLEPFLREDPHLTINSINSSKPVTFKSNAVEKGFQHKLAALKSVLWQHIYVGLSLIHGIVALVTTPEFTFPNLLTWSLTVVSLGVIIQESDIFSGGVGSSKKKKKLRASSRQRNQKKSQQSAFSSLLNPQFLKTTLLIAVQELNILPDPLNIYAWLGLFCLGTVVHLSLAESLQADRLLLRTRVSLQAAVLFLGLFYLTWRQTLGLLARLFLSHFLALNLQAALNKALRQLYGYKEGVKLWSNQLFEVLDSIPYPLFLVDKADIKTLGESKEPFLKIAYFNFMGELLMRKGYSPEIPQDEPEFINFLDLIDPADVITLYEKTTDLAGSHADDGHSEDDINFAPKGVVFETVIPKKVFEAKPPPKTYKHDVFLWNCPWKEKEMVVLMFSNDRFTNKFSKKFETRFIKALNYLRDKTEKSLMSYSNLVSKYHANTLNKEELASRISEETATLWTKKLTCDNLLIFDNPWEEQLIKTFKIKNLVINMVDWMFKNQKVQIDLEFLQGYAHLVKTNFQMMRALLYCIFQHLQTHLIKGYIGIICDKEPLSENFIDNKNHSFNTMLKFIFLVGAPEGCPLPPANFFNNIKIDLQKVFSEAKSMEELIPFWIDMLKENMSVTATYETKENARLNPKLKNFAKVLSFCVSVPINEETSSMRLYPVKIMTLREHFTEQSSQQNNIFTWKVKEETKSIENLRKTSEASGFIGHSMRGLMLNNPRKGSMMNRRSDSFSEPFKQRPKIQVQNEPATATPQNLSTPGMNSSVKRILSKAILSPLNGKNSISKSLASMSPEVLRNRQKENKLQNPKIAELLRNHLSSYELSMKPQYKEILHFLNNEEDLTVESSDRLTRTLGQMASYFEILIKSLFLDSKSKFMNSEYIKELLKEELDSIKGKEGSMTRRMNWDDKNQMSISPSKELKNKAESIRSFASKSEIKQLGLTSDSNKSTSLLKSAMDPLTKTKSYRSEIHQKSQNLLMKRDSSFRESVSKVSKHEWKEEIVHLSYHDKFTVLIVDDSTDQAQHLSSLFLEFSDVETHVCYDGLEAVQKVKLEMDLGLMYHMIITDLLMPHDGFETAKDIRREERTRKTSPKYLIMAITADTSSPTLEVKASQAQIDKLQQKDFDLSKVEKTLKDRAKEMGLENKYAFKRIE